MVLIRSRCVFIIRDEDRKRGLKAETSNAWGEREQAEDSFLPHSCLQTLVNKHD